MQFFALEQTARSASMANRITSEAARKKREDIEAPSTVDSLSLNFSQFVFTHFGRKLAQLLAYVHLFSGKSKQGMRFGQVARNARTCQIHLRKIELRVCISLLRSPGPQFERLLHIPADSLAAK